MRRRGFSLIELLVVIAIIAILAAVLFPIYVSARENGKRARCISNLKQLGGSIYMYADDWNGWIFPRIYNEHWTSRPEFALPATDFTTANRRYVKNAFVYRCPDDGNNRMPQDRRFAKQPDGVPERISYIYMGKDIWADEDETGDYPRRNITDKQKYKGPFGNQGWLMRDKDFFTPNDTDPDRRLATTHGVAPVPWTKGLPENHLNAGSNVLLFDGSVEWRRDWDG